MRAWSWAGLLLLATGCAQEPLISTATLEPRPPATVTASPAPTATLQPTPTATSIPTPHPDAITPETAAQVRLARVLSGHKGPVWGVAIAPDGEQVATGSSDYDVRVWDADSGELLRVLERHRGWVYAVGYTPDGEMLVSAGRDQTVQVWDAGSDAHLFGMRAFGEAFRLAFSPDGERVAVASLYSARGQVWPLEAGATWLALEGHATRLRSVAFSPDGALLATGDAGGTILLRDGDSGQPLETLQARGEVFGLAFSPDGTTLVAGGSDGWLRTFDVDSGAERMAWPAHAGGVWSVALSPGGDVLASGGLDGLVALWDVATGLRLATLSHGTGVRAVAFSRDGVLVASSGDDWQARLWRVAH